mgnify:CR=1 FL=1
MSEQKGPIPRFLENASPEEQKRLGRALLDAEEKKRGAEVSEVVVRRSRLLSLIPLAALLVHVAFDAGPRLLLGSVLLFAVAWFPNEVAAGTGLLGMRPAVTRASHAGILLGIVWAFLVLFVVRAVLKLAA